MIVLNTIREALSFLDSFDGYGMVSTDEDLQLKELLNYNLIDDYTIEERKEYEIFLKNKEELKDINLIELNYFELKELAEKYGY